MSSAYNTEFQYRDTPPHGGDDGYGKDAHPTRRDGLRHLLLSLLSGNVTDRECLKKMKLPRSNALGRLRFPAAVMWWYA